jgi:hypothetical protein
MLVHEIDVLWAPTLNWPIDKNVKELRIFLGLAGYYRKFVKNFGVIARPLNDLLKKNTTFNWTTKHDQAFHTLQHALVQAPVLALPDFSMKFIVVTNALDYGICVVLMQGSCPIAFVSKALDNRLRGLSTFERGILQSY